MPKNTKQRSVKQISSLITCLFTGGTANKDTVMMESHVPSNSWWKESRLCQIKSKSKVRAETFLEANMVSWYIAQFARTIVGILKIGPLNNSFKMQSKFGGTIRRNTFTLGRFEYFPVWNYRRNGQKKCLEKF